MRLLDACLALALTLGVFAGLVTLLVEVIESARASREKTLRKMLGLIFDHAVKNGLFNELPNKDAGVIGWRKDFLNTLGASHALSASQTDNATDAQMGLFTRLFAPRSAFSVTLADAIRRLSNTQLVSAAGDKKDEFIKKLEAELSDGYARFERIATESYRTGARNTSFVVGVVVALAVNVNAMRLFDAFIADPQLTAETIKVMQQEAQAQQKAVQEKGNGEAKSTDGQPASPPQPDPEKVSRALLEWAEGARIAGFPVGWAYFPYCQPPTKLQVDPRCLGNEANKTTVSADEKQEKATQSTGQGKCDFNLVRWIQWLIATLFTGLLIGLGGPFWFDVAVSLAKARDIVRNLPGAGQKGGQTPATGGQPGSSAGGSN